jgi:hypothetical protein
MRKGLVLTSVVLVVALCGTVRADWDPKPPDDPKNHKMHFAQLPDLQPTGLDVYGSDTEDYKQIYLADDWRCSASGPVKDIHIWGSWLNDAFDHHTMAWVGFHLVIFKDIPADESETGYSMPGEKLWDCVFAPPEDTIGPHYQVRRYATADEGFYDPEEGAIIGSDTQVWQYNFLIDEANAFRQVKGTVYWLGVQAIVDTPLPGPLWGWKTSLDHWNDDAVWGQGWTPPEPPNWYELRYPDGHRFEGESIDLAFVITPEPTTMCLFGLGGIGLSALRRRRFGPRPMRRGRQRRIPCIRRR